MGWSQAIRILFLTALTSASGCATLSPESAFIDVASAVDERTGQTIRWIDGAASQSEVSASSTRLLARELTPAAAVRLALLNNASLQATYARLGIAQADLVQAALAPNPVAAGSLTFADSGAVNMTFAGAFQVIELLRIPLKKRVAASRLEEAKIEVAAQVLRTVAQTQMAFIDYQAAEQSAAYLRSTLQAAKASASTAKRLRQAGNMTALDLERQNGEVVRAELDLTKAEIRAASAREELSTLMGLEGDQTRWRASAHLPEVPREEIATGNAEARALANSLDLALARQRLTTLEQRLGVAASRGALPGTEAGGEWKQDEGAEEAGPTFAASLPLFDWGQARKARARMEINRARHIHQARKVEVEASARALKANLLAARKSALYHQATALPQANRLMRAAQRQHNAMQIGVFDLIRAKRQQITASQQQISARADYWIARAKFLQLMRGTLPETSDGGQTAAAERD